MTRIAEKFIDLQKRGEKALIPFFFAGDPDMETTAELVHSAEKSGADIIELGIPYSDPLADGPVNQVASARALKNGIRLYEIFTLVKRLRKLTQVPIVFLLYFNCIMQYGIERFLEDCMEAGVDGLVIPDLPYEEKISYQGIFNQYDIDIIAMVTPASQQRIPMVVQNAKGFIYCVTSSGVTGVRSSFNTDFSGFMNAVKKHSSTPRMLGFGISTPDQVAGLKNYAEGVIVGSAIVKLIGKGLARQELLSEFSEFIASLKAALK